MTETSTKLMLNVPKFPFLFHEGGIEDDRTAPQIRAQAETRTNIYGVSTKYRSPGPAEDADTHRGNRDRLMGP